MSEQTTPSPEYYEAMARQALVFRLNQHAKNVARYHPEAVASLHQALDEHKARRDEARRRRAEEAGE